MILLIEEWVGVPWAPHGAPRHPANASRLLVLVILPIICLITLTSDLT